VPAPCHTGPQPKVNLYWLNDAFQLQRIYDVWGTKITNWHNVTGRSRDLFTVLSQNRAGMTKTTKHLRQDSRPPSWEMNRRSPTYKRLMLTIQQPSSVLTLWRSWSESRLGFSEDYLSSSMQMSTQILNQRSLIQSDSECYLRWTVRFALIASRWVLAFTVLKSIRSTANDVQPTASTHCASYTIRSPFYTFTGNFSVTVLLRQRRRKMKTFLFLKKCISRN
jgi:hypothetical protein